MLISKLKPGAGQTLIEMLVVIGIMGLIIPALFAGFIASRQGQDNDQQKIQATILQKEAFEAVRSIREVDWTNIANTVSGNNYYPSISGVYWQLNSGSQTVGPYTRVVKLYDVNRNTTTGDIVTSGGVLDPSTKRVEVTISWNAPIANSIVSSQYLSRYLNNQAITQPTVTYTFPSGTGTNVKMTATDVSLGQVDTGRSDWCTPNIIRTLDLPKSAASRTVTANPFEAFVGLGVDTTRPSLVKVDITDTVPPANPVLTIGAQFPTTGTGYITNHVFGVGNFAYLATTDNAKDIVILQKSGSTYSEVGSFNAGGSTGSGVNDADSVFVVGTKGYMTQGNVLRVINLTANTGVRPELGFATFGPASVQGSPSSVTGKVFVRGNYAYVAIKGDANELEIFNITANTPQKVATGSVNGSAAQDIFVNPDGDRTYIVTNYDSALPEFFILDTTNKSLPLHTLPTNPIGTYNTTDNMSPRAVEVVLADYRAIIAGSTGQEYQVLSLYPETAPTKCGGMDVNTGVYDIAGVKEPDGDAYAYITTGDTASEFKAIEGGPGALLAPEGTYDSTTMSLPANAMFNRFQAIVDKPAGSNIRFQVAVAQAVSNSCAAAVFSFEGPDGSASTYYETAATGTNIEIADKIPFGSTGSYTNPGRCFKYRAELTPTSNLMTSSVLKSVKINYTP